jgi:hypothetical protein
MRGPPCLRASPVGHFLKRRITIGRRSNGVLRRQQRPYQGGGLFPVLMYVACQAARGYGAGAYPVMTGRQAARSSSGSPCST